MKQLIACILVSLFVLYLIVSFIGLTPDVTKWETGGRAAYLLFGIIFGIMGYIIHFEANKSDRPNNIL
jgi:hypothetical protein